MRDKVVLMMLQRKLLRDRRRFKREERRRSIQVLERFSIVTKNWIRRILLFLLLVYLISSLQCKRPVMSRLKLGYWLIFSRF
jgi:hypothetical protein